MQSTISLLALCASAVMAQSAGGPASGCQSSFSGTFSFNTRNISSSSQKMARGLDDVLDAPVRRQEASCGSSLTLTLKDSVLLDAKGRTGYIAANNHQFQFDGPPQNPHSFTSGFSLCSNGSLALGNSAIFYNCLSGTFDNIYDQSQGAQCYPVVLDTFPCAATGSVATAPTSLISAPGESTNSQVATTSSAASQSSVATSAAQTSAPVVTSKAVVSTPYPVTGNLTRAAPTGTAPGVTTPVTTNPAGTSSPAPSAFKGAASVLAVGQGFVAIVAAAGAFFML